MHYFIAIDAEINRLGDAARHKGSRPMTATFKNLDELLAAMRAGEIDENAFASLPTFGGEEPRNTNGVWSWNATHVLVGEGKNDFAILDRNDPDGWWN